MSAADSTNQRIPINRPTYRIGLLGSRFRIANGSHCRNISRIRKCDRFSNILNNSVELNQWMVRYELPLGCQSIALDPTVVVVVALLAGFQLYTIEHRCIVSQYS
jgi:hypothetical protein